MTNRLTAVAASALLGSSALAGCTAMPDSTNVASAPETPAMPQATGYFAQESTLPFHAPDFTKFRDSDYQPAIEQGIALTLAEARAIAENPEAPTFENTIVAMEKSGQVLGRVMSVFGQVQGANTNDTIDAAQAAVAPKLASMRDEIYLNDKLFQRVKAVHDNRASMTMTPEAAMLLQVTYDEFVHRGANLTPAQKDELKAMNSRIAELETAFSQKLTEATAAKAPIFDTREELAGLTDAQITAAAKLASEKGAPGKYAIALINTTQQPMLTQLTNRATRKKLWDASINRTSGGDKHDTTAIIAETAELRAKKAALLGQSSFAEYAMYDRMVKEPAKAISFMEGFIPALSATQTREAKMLSAAAKAAGQPATIEPWDWSYWAEKVRKAQYDLDESEIKPYFEVWNTLENGVFFAANKFYGISFKRRTDLPTYHPDMRVYTVLDKDGSELGLFYFDPFSRPNKQGGAWMGNFVDQSFMTGYKPVVHNTQNIAPPAAGEPALATWDDVNTMFHEFGHALHGLFASQQYPSLSGTATARDFVEFPSQFNENFATEPWVLANFAKHHQTGQQIPKALVDKIKAAGKFNQSLGLGETLTAALLDMKWHALTPADGRQDPMAFEKKAVGTIALNTTLIPPRYKTPYFRHIWEGGYAAGYYSYIWTEVLAHDAWNWVETNGGPTRANGDHARATFLGQGHTKDFAEMYRDYAGRDPQIDPMLEARGLK